MAVTRQVKEDKINRGRNIPICSSELRGPNDPQIAVCGVRCAVCSAACGVLRDGRPVLSAMTARLVPRAGQGAHSGSRGRSGCRRSPRAVAQRCDSRSRLRWAPPCGDTSHAEGSRSRSPPNAQCSLRKRSTGGADSPSTTFPRR